MRIHAILSAAAIVAGLAAASPITFTISTSGSGTINGLTFTDGTIIFTAVTDTTNILNGPETIGDTGNSTSSPQGTDTVTIVGLGSWTLSDPVAFFDDRTTGVVGFFDLRPGDVFVDLLDISGTPFSTYDLKSSLGPISDPLANGTGTFTNIPTSIGTLAFTGNSTNASFQAVTAGVPEPGSLALMMLGALGLHALRSRIVRRGYDLYQSGSHRDCVVARTSGDASGAGSR
jgi:PEP-CTERM motif